MKRELTMSGSKPSEEWLKNVAEFLVAHTNVEAVEWRPSNPEVVVPIVDGQRRWARRATEAIDLIEDLTSTVVQPDSVRFPRAELLANRARKAKAEVSRFALGDRVRVKLGTIGAGDVGVIEETRASGEFLYRVRGKHTHLWHSPDSIEPAPSSPVGEGVPERLPETLPVGTEWDIGGERWRALSPMRLISTDRYNPPHRTGPQGTFPEERTGFIEAADIDWPSYHRALAAQRGKADRIFSPGKTFAMAAAELAASDPEPFSDSATRCSFCHDRLDSTASNGLHLDCAAQLQRREAAAEAERVAATRVDPYTLDKRGRVKDEAAIFHAQTMQNISVDVAKAIKATASERRARHKREIRAEMDRGVPHVWENGFSSSSYED